jgi:ribosome maturation factor RimP
MAKVPIAQLVMNLIEPVLVAEGLELVDVEYKKEGKSWALRIFIDKEKGITVEDCQKISRLTGDLIDVEETIKTPYNLEVSSPGLDRSLKREKDFLKFKGKRIRLQSLSPIDGRRKFTGVLTDFKDDIIYMDLEDGKPFEILLPQMLRANLVIEI